MNCGTSILFGALTLVAALLAVAPDVAMAENRHPHGHVDLDDDDADVDEDEEAEGLDSPEEDVREPKYRRNSPPMMWAGIVLTSVGGTAVLGATATYGATADDKSDVSTARGVAAIVGLTGIACLGVGIPLLVVGARKKPVRREDAAIPTVRMWGTGAELSWTF